MFKCKCPNANLSNNTLVLSLPDAITPVVWVMDVEKEGTFVIKVEKQDSFFTLQKVTKKGVIEDIAFYKNKKKALRAMTTITNATQSTNAQNRSQRFYKALFYIFAIGGLGYFLYTPTLSLIGTILSKFSTPSSLVQESSLSKKESSTIEPQDTNAVGVPMSADAFLKNKNTGLPF